MKLCKDKGQGLNFQKRILYTYILKLDWNKISILYQNELCKYEVYSNYDVRILP